MTAAVQSETHLVSLLDCCPAGVMSPSVEALDGSLKMAVASGLHVMVNEDIVLTKSEVQAVVLAALREALASVADAV